MGLYRVYMGLYRDEKIYIWAYIGIIYMGFIYIYIYIGIYISHPKIKLHQQKPGVA